MVYDVLLWDLDGTLTDSKQGIILSVQYALNQLGYPTPDKDELTWVVGPPLKDSFKILLQTSHEELIKQAILLYRDRFSTKGLYENAVYPGIPELLQQLKERGCKNLLATSKPRIYAERILDYFSLKQYFEVVMGSDFDGRFIEKKDLIAEVLRQAPMSSDSRKVMIGDRKFDVHGARANCLDVISVGYGYGTLEELEAEHPNYLIHSVAELSRFLLG